MDQRPADSQVSQRERLRHVRWIGGGSRAGKSTAARSIAERYGLRYYSTDDAMADHAARCEPDRCPRLVAFLAMSLDERWVDRSPSEMLDTFHWFGGEAFDLVVDDLLDLAPEPVVVEGFRLLPHLVEPLAFPRRAVWLLPTPEFRLAAVERQPTVWQFLESTRDPDAARRNLLERDRRFTEHLREEAKRLDLATIAVDTGTTEDNIVDRLYDALDL